VDCQAGYYTAGRFVRDMKCSECGGALAVVPEGDRAEVEADPVDADPVDTDPDAASPAVAETTEASSAR